MLSVLYSAAGGLDSAAKTQEVLARNIAFASHPGYKRATLSFADELRNAAGEAVAVSANEGIAFDQGELLRTDSPFDLAIDGEGFFTLRRPDGSLLYTRNGSFMLGEDGRIVTASGLTLLGDSGPILLSPGSRLLVQPDGTVLSDGQVAGKLRISDFPDKSVLRRAGTTLFEETGAVSTAMPAVDTRVRQGYIERANVDILTEMVHMIENSRSFQASQRITSSVDAAMRSLTRAAEE